MRAFGLCGKIGLSLALLVVAFSASNCGRNNVDIVGPDADVATKDPVRLLVRNRNTGMLAVDGILFQVHLLTAEKAEELSGRLRLRSDDNIDVQEESGIEYRSPGGGKETPTPVAWRNDPKDFDFLVTWTMDSVEQKKSSFNADLVIAVKEEWKIEKVSDPSVTRTWNCNYTLRAPGGFEKGLLEKTAYEQTNAQIIPARGPIITAVRSFILDN